MPMLLMTMLRPSILVPTPRVPPPEWFLRSYLPSVPLPRLFTLLKDHVLILIITLRGCLFCWMEVWFYQVATMLGG